MPSSVGNADGSLPGLRAGSRPESQPVPQRNSRSDSEQGSLENSNGSRPLDNAGQTPDSAQGHIRQDSDWGRFYNNQKNSFSCGPVALGMAIGDHRLGRPPSDSEITGLVRETGTNTDGFPGGNDNMARQAQRFGLHATPYNFRPGDLKAVQALDQELAQGHSAVVHVNNPLTGNGHFIYVAGKTADGQYLIGDPNRRGNLYLEHNRPISREHLASMMLLPQHGRRVWQGANPGFAAVW